MTVIPPRVAAVLLGPGGLASYLRRHAGEDPEVDLIGLRLTLAARRHAMRQTVQSVGWVTNDQDDQLVSTDQAARSIGRHRSTISRMIHRGDLPAVLVGGRWAVRLADLAALAERRTAA